MMNALLSLWLLGAPVAGAEAHPSPAQQKIALAQRAIEKKPDAARPYAELAFALARRARETSDPAFYLEADAAIAKALERDPQNYDALKARAWVLLGKHEFAKAFEEATALQRRSPDDLAVYSFLADANVELGRYAEAEEAAQWMLDLRPGNVPGLTRGAHLRELFGDLDGALEFMAKALDRTETSEPEERAWILTQIGHLQLLAGRVGEAEAALDEALGSFPGYHYALAQLASVRAAQERLSDAVELLKRRYAAAPHPENLYDLALALERAGQGAEAAGAFAKFEVAARTESASADNSNRELILFYADHGRAKDALALAEREVRSRRDVATLDAWAWALHRNGRKAQAIAAIDEALKVGSREPRLLSHADAIRGLRSASAAR